MSQIIRQALTCPKSRWAELLLPLSQAISGTDVASDHIWPMGSTSHSQAESHTELKWTRVYIRPLTGGKSLGYSWAQIFGEQLMGQIWLRPTNGPKYWANN